MSLTGITAYLRPQTLEEAYSCLGSGALAVAGGTDVLRHTHVGVHTLVDVSALPLRYIRDERGFAIGANATLTDLLEHPGLAAYLDGVIAGMLRAGGLPAAAQRRHHRRAPGEAALQRHRAGPAGPRRRSHGVRGR